MGLGGNVQAEVDPKEVAERLRQMRPEHPRLLLAAGGEEVQKRIFSANRFYQPQNTTLAYWVAQ